MEDRNAQMGQVRSEASSRSVAVVKAVAAVRWQTTRQARRHGQTRVDDLPSETQRAAGGDTQSWGGGQGKKHVGHGGVFGQM